MAQIPLKLQRSLENRKKEGLLRQLIFSEDGIDFFSNDYLGLARCSSISEEAQVLLEDIKTKNGATGSRLISGNHRLYAEVEATLACFHDAEAALIFNSGYDANVGFFSSVPQRNDIIIYDELIHASIRDGIKMSLAKNFNFRHNDLDHLKERLNSQQLSKDQEIYVVTESVFSMDGDSPNLEVLTALKNDFNIHLVIDEAHATGVFGESGCGMVQKLDLQKHFFARIQTFGKSMGCHGAVILGSKDLKEYLVNFSRSFIYTTALPPHAVATIISAYKHLNNNLVQQLQHKIAHFKTELEKNQISAYFIESHSAIQSAIIPGNIKATALSEKLRKNGFLVKAILSPTVTVGSERIRFCIHAYNSFEEISAVLKLVAKFVAKLKNV